MNISSENDILLYIYKENSGAIDKLKNEIGEIKVDQLEAMGYIENAVNPNGNTWKISKQAKDMAKSIYRESTLIEKIIDWFNFRIRKIDFSY